MAASTHNTEELFAAKTHILLKKKIKNIITIIIPRHINRVDQIISQINELGLNVISRRSNKKKLDNIDIYLVDTFGESKKFYKFATTVFSARQKINHGHIRVNKKRVNISSYLVKESDLIEVREKSKKLTVIDGSLQSKERDIPEYIKSDSKNKSIQLVRIPKFSEVPYPVIMEPNLVIEYYSR